MMLDHLKAACRAGQLSEIALHFAEFVGRLEPNADDNVLLAAALASQSAVSGETCINLKDLAGNAVLQGKNDSEICAPKLSTWRAILVSSPSVSTGVESSLLALEDDRLYLSSYRDWEDRLAAAIRVYAEGPDIEIDQQLFNQELSALFPEDFLSVEQERAVVLSINRRFSVITGGPGTGKTTTVASLLALLQCLQTIEPNQIALSAPTGKAAARLREVMAHVYEKLGLSSNLLPANSITMHRLLGRRSGEILSRSHPDSPLPYRIIVVDEASMVDLVMMTQLFEALPETSRLIILGDKDQLASVEVGAVLGDICEVMNAGFLVQSVSVLRTSWRFGDESQLSGLSAAIIDGDTEQVYEAINSTSQSNISRREILKHEEFADNLRDHCISDYAKSIELVLEGASPETVFNEISKMQVLAAHRTGPQSVEEINQMVSMHLADRGLIYPSDGWYPGRRVLITENDYNLGLFNGDIGVTFRDNNPDVLKVVFPRPEGGWRSISPGRLPRHQTVYAMTVHKSQGSEYDRVIMVLPQTISPILTRSLLYTAVTRAISKLEIWGSDEVLRTAIEADYKRTSGLQRRLIRDL